MILNLRYILGFIFILLLVQSASAQLEIGVKAGVNFGNIQILNVDNSNISEMNVDNRLGFQFGLLTRINIVKIYIQPEVLFTQLNAEINVTGIDNRENSFSYKLNRIDIPFPIGIKLGAVGIFAGPVASFNLNSANQMFSETYKQGTWSLLGGVSVKFWKMDVEIIYEGALTEFANEASVKLGDEIHAVPLELRNSQFILSLGYKF